MSEIDLREIGRRARQAGQRLPLIATERRNQALYDLADRLDDAGDELWEANAADLEDARQAGVAPALIDRSTLNEKRVAAMADGCRSVASLADPLGELIEGRTLPNGMHVAKRRVPLGVLGVIFESRPNVTTEISALCLKTGNAVIMRGGRESLRTNKILVEIIRAVYREHDVPQDAAQLISSTDRSLVPELLAMDDVIDLLIPRGGPGLQNLVRQHAKMPVIYGGIGVCHLFVDATADLERSIPVINNAKTQAPSVCNSLDTILVHADVAARFLPQMARNLVESEVKVLCDERSWQILEGFDQEFVNRASEEDFGKEFLALTLSVKVVDSLEKAIAHIKEHGTNHSDGILTNSYENAQTFLDQIDSAATYVNASTRFTDGGQFGLGAEVAISTQRLHARGPVGLKELTTYKWIVQGDYTVRP